jgi:hypothetical protein
MNAFLPIESSTSGVAGTRWLFSPWPTRKLALAIWAYELHLLGAAGPIGALVSADVGYTARHECRLAFFTHAFQFQGHFVSYSPSDDRKAPPRPIGPISSDDCPTRPRSDARLGGICQPCLRDSWRIRAASRMKFGFRMIFVAFSSAESLRTNSDKQSIKRLPRQFTSS